MAFVELVEGHEFSEQAIIRHCRDRLAAYKVPRAVRLVHELPRSPTGKILRRDLQKLL